MVVEIVAGTIYGSMALLADGWHMGTHAAAFGITLFAYRYAKKHAESERFSFGTGKVSVLGGYTSAIALGIVALLMLVESVHRLFNPQAIQFNEAIIVAFRRHTLLSLDDCLYALQPSIPHLSRSALHRCLHRHGISRLPDIEGDKPKRQKFKRYPIGFFHIDIAEVQTEEGKLYLFVGIDRTSKFAVTQLVEKANRKTAWEFLEHLLKQVPYRIHTILTDNGIQFAEQPRNRNTAYSRQMRFDMICEANGIEHRLTKPNHPWTNGQVERMNRTIKEATVKRFHYESHDQLRTHLTDFMAAYNFARRLKTLNGLTPYEYICKIWTSEPDRFILNPIHQMPGLNT